MQLKNKILTLGFILFLIYCNTIYSQSLRITTYNVDNGLPTDVAKCIIQDELGFIWIGTDDGIVRFDGKKTLIFSNQLPSNYVKRFLKTKNGRILVVCDLGIVEIDSKPDTTIFKTIIKGLDKVSVLNDSTVNFPKSIYEDSKGNIWFGDYGNISCLSNGKLKKYIFSADNNTSSFSRSFCFAEDGFGHLWATSFPGNLFYYDEQNDKFIEVQLKQRLSSVSDLITVEKGHLLAGCSTGLFDIRINQSGEVVSCKFVRNFGSISCFIMNNKKQIFAGTWSNGLHVITFSNDSIKTQNISLITSGAINDLLYSKSTDDIWVCTNDGINLLQSTYFGTISITNNISDYIQSFTQSADSVIYVSTGPGIVEVKKTKNGYSGNYIYYWTKNGFIARIQADKYGIWIGDSNGSFYFYNFKTKTLEEISKKRYGRYCLFLIKDEQNNLWACQDEYQGIVRITPDKKIIEYKENQGINTQPHCIKISHEGKIYCGSETTENYLYVFDNASEKFKKIILPLPLIPEKHFIINDLAIDYNKTIWLGTSEGLFKYSNQKIERINLGDIYTKDPIKALTIDNKGLWIANSYGVIRYMNDNVFFFDKSSGLPANTITVRNLYIDNCNKLWVGTAKGAAYSFNNEQSFKTTNKPIILSIRINGKKSEIDSVLNLSHDSFIEIEFASLSYPSDKLKYQYKIPEKNDNWSYPADERKLIITQLPKGKYSIVIRGELIGNNYQWSLPAVIRFNVLSAWYVRWWAICLFVLFIIVLIYGIVQFYTWKLNRDKIRLEGIVKIRTTEVERQKHEILLQSEELKVQKEVLVQQNEQIKSQNQNIVSSIRYAQTIQNAILPDKLEIDKYFESFILYLPKDIVSGDFYWYHELESSKDYAMRMLIAVVDCTGHGVPGAFMSMISNRLLFEIVTAKKIHLPNEILSQLDADVKDALKQEHSENNDGMDMCLCLLEKNNQHTKVTFSGAKRPLYFYSFIDPVLKVIHGDRKTIGGIKTKRNKEVFTNTEIILNFGDLLYLTTDGLIDSTSPERKRFGSNKFIELLNSFANDSLIVQKTKIEKELVEYQKDQPQRDDITIIGLKL